MPVVRAAGSNEPGPSSRSGSPSYWSRNCSENGGAGAKWGPVIFEIPAPQTKSIDVIVVWEAWKDLPAEDRISVIRGAYAQFKRSLRVTLQEGDPGWVRWSHAGLCPTGIVIGATWKDVEDLNLLPMLCRTPGEAGRG